MLDNELFILNKMEPKKISFGFSKTIKKHTLINKQQSEEENNVEFIKCVEEKQIQPMVEKQKKAELIIPMKENQKTSTALASLMRRRAILLGEEEFVSSENENKSNIEENISLESENLDARAARELLAETKKINPETTQGEKLVLPLVKPDDLPLDGAKEPTLDDYENIPIQEYGLAMLRGMGWIEPAKKNKLVDDGPIMRPKGMGLGADKALKPKPLLVQPEAGETLEIKRNAYVRILGGKRNDLYGQIESLDEYAGRVFVRLALGGIRESFNEFLCQPVSKKEYEQYSRCINNTKYEEYKTSCGNLSEMIVKKENNETQRVENENQMKTDEPCSSFHEFSVRYNNKNFDNRGRKPSRSRHDLEKNRKTISRCSSSESIEEISCDHEIRAHNRGPSSDYDDSNREHKKETSRIKKSKEGERKKHNSSSLDKTQHHKSHKKRTKKSKKHRSRS